MEDQRRDKVLRGSALGIFLILLVGLLYFAKSFLLPVTLAFLLALVLSPVVRHLGRRGIPGGVSAVLLVLVLSLGLAAASYSLSGPLSETIDDVPRIAFEMRSKLAGLDEPIKAVKQAGKTFDEATQGEPDPGVQEVVVREPGLLTWAASGAPSVIAGVGLVLALLLFLLASGDLFYEKLVRVMPTFEDKKRWARIVKDVEREVSRYLLAIAVINIGLGTSIGAALYFLGAPDPILWGVAAALLNFIPYVGPLIGIAGLAMVSIVTFDTLGEAMLPPFVYLLINVLEGQFITPVLVGRRLQINAVSVFLAIAFWGWLWGFIGVLMAVPILIVVKTFSQHAEGLAALEEFLSPRLPREDE